MTLCVRGDQSGVSFVARPAFCSAGETSFGGEKQAIDNLLVIAIYVIRMVALHLTPIT